MRARWCLGLALALVLRGTGPRRRKKEGGGRPSFKDYVRNLELKETTAKEAQCQAPPSQCWPARDGCRDDVSEADAGQKSSRCREVVRLSPPVCPPVEGAPAAMVPSALRGCASAKKTTGPKGPVGKRKGKDGKAPDTRDGNGFFLTRARIDSINESRCCDQAGCSSECVSRYREWRESEDFPEQPGCTQRRCTATTGFPAAPTRLSRVTVAVIFRQNGAE
jgi:hypothetical protein